MERIGPRRAGDENGDGTTSGRTGAVRAAAVTVAVVAALAGCSVTVQPKNAAATSPLTSSPTSSAASSAAASTSAPSSSPSPTPAPSDVDHTVCVNVRAALATLKSKLATDKGSASRSAVDYHNAGTALRTQDSKTDNAQLKSTLRTVGTDYQTVGHDVANHESTDADLGKVAEASKPLSTLCGVSIGSTGSSSTNTSASTTSTSTTSG